MTDTLLDPSDTGEIKRLASLGDDPTRNLAKFAMTTDTEVIAYANLVYSGRRPDATVELPLVPIVPGPDSFLPPGQPQVPRPLPRPLPTPPKAGLIVEWEVAPPTETLSLLGSLGPILPQPLLVKPVAYVGRHRAQARWFTPLVELYATVYATLRDAL
jgi:hypothetical protein